MKSRASIKSHPLHPILVGFPISFFTAAFISDLVCICSSDPFFSEMGKYLVAAGILFALLAAVPGFIDYQFTVPPNSTAKNRATKHALLNITMLFVFVMVLLLRKNAEVSLYFILLLEGIGLTLMGFAGWLGGTLVGRNQIGIDHRYAAAGKWKEEKLNPSERILLKDATDLKLNQMKLLHVGEKRIVLARTESGLVAFEDRCSHRGASLADGVLICGTVQCPWHGSQFNTKTGEVLAGPSKEKIQTYGIATEEGANYLILKKSDFKN